MKTDKFEVYEAIVTYRDENLMSPTVRELCEIVGVKSTSTIDRLLRAMQAHGMISMRPRISRSILPRPVEDWDEVLRAEQQARKGRGADPS